MVKKLFLNNVSSDKWRGVLTNLLKTSCSKSESLLRKIKNFFLKYSSRYVQRSSWNTRQTVHSKLHKNFHKERNLFEIFFVKLLQRTCRMELGHPFQKLIFQAQKYASTFQELSANFVPLDVFNAGSTFYRKLQFKDYFFWKKLSRMWYRTCNLQIWWQCPITFGQNAKTFRINSNSLFRKSSSFYVECSFTENCRTFCPLSPKAYFAIKFPCTREKEIWQVSRKLFAQNPKSLCLYRKNITKMILRARGMKFWRLWFKKFCSQSVKKIQAISEKHFSQTVRLDSLQNALLTTLLKTFRSTSGGLLGTVRKNLREYKIWTRRKQFWQPCQKTLSQIAKSVQESVSQQCPIGPKNKELWYPSQ